VLPKVGAIAPLADLALPQLKDIMFGRFPTRLETQTPAPRALRP
jgi:hypothetical protein